MKKILLVSIPVILILASGFLFYPANSSMCVVYPSKMNVFYIGVDNPIDIQATGVDPNDLQPTVTGGSIAAAGGYGHYIVRFSSANLWETTVTVKQRMDSADSKDLGSFKFRIKHVPNPIFYVYNHKWDDTIAAFDLSNQLGIFTKMENFDFDCGFRPVSFAMTTYHDSIWHDMKATGALFTDEMKQQLKLLEHGDRVILSNIKVKMNSPSADTAERKIPGAYFIIR